MDDSTLDTVNKAEGDPVSSMVILCGVERSNQAKITYVFAASTNGHTPSGCHLKARVISAAVAAGSHAHTVSTMLKAFLCVHVTSCPFHLRPGRLGAQILCKYVNDLLVPRLNEKCIHRLHLEG